MKHPSSELSIGLEWTIKKINSYLFRYKTGNFSFVTPWDCWQLEKLHLAVTYHQLHIWWTAARNYILWCITTDSPMTTKHHGIDMKIDCLAQRFLRMIKSQWVIAGARFNFVWNQQNYYPKRDISCIHQSTFCGQLYCQDMKWHYNVTTPSYGKDN